MPAPREKLMYDPGQVETVFGYTWCEYPDKTTHIDEAFNVKVVPPTEFDEGEG